MAAQLNIRSGSILWLSADLSRMAFLAMRKEKGFDASRFIRSFQDQLGKDGTLAIPAFNFNLRDKDHYSLQRTLPITGALATEAMKTGHFIRTKNPLHSFLVWGKASKALAALDNKSSFGMDSPFAFFHNYRAEMLIIGTSVSNAFTFVHYVEELHKVNYRNYKKISLFLDDKGCWEDFLLYAKKPGWTMALTGIEKLLVVNGIAVCSQINGINCTRIDLAASFPVIGEDISHNRAQNISRFSSKLYLRDNVKPILSKLGLYTPSDKISRDPGLL